MILLSYLLGSIEKYVYYKGSKNEYNIIYMFLFASISLFIISFFYYDKFNFSFISNIFNKFNLNNSLFYIVLLLENLFVFVSLKNFQKQKTYSEISFILFNSIWLINVLLFLFYNFFNFNIQPFINNSNLFYFSITIFLISLLFFNKLKINNPILLLIYLLTISILGFFATSLIKIYQQGFLIYSIINFTIFLQYAIYYKFKLKFNNLSLFSIFSFVLKDLLSIIALKFLPITIFIFTKRLGQFHTGLLLDKQENKKEIKNSMLILINILLILTLIVFFII